MTILVNTNTHCANVWLRVLFDASTLNFTYAPASR